MTLDSYIYHTSYYDLSFVNSNNNKLTNILLTVFIKNNDSFLTLLVPLYASSLGFTLVIAPAPALALILNLLIGKYI